MTIARALLATVLSLLPLAGHGQALPTASGPGSNITLGAGLSWFQQDYGRRTIGGGFSYVELHPQWRYGLVGEARLLRLNTSQQVTQSTYLAGIKAGLRPRPTRTEPYVKVLAGAGRMTLPFAYAHGTFLTYAVGGGVDYSLNDRFTLRLADVEIQRYARFPYGNLQPYGLSMGISLRLTPTRHFPRGSWSSR